jgi:hypothetical protein
MDLNMTKLPTRESPPQVNEEQLPRHRNVYDYGGEYEFPSAQHWTAPRRSTLNSLQEPRDGQG